MESSRKPIVSEFCKFVSVAVELKNEYAFFRARSFRQVQPVFFNGYVGRLICGGKKGGKGGGGWLGESDGLSSDSRAGVAIQGVLTFSEIKRFKL